MRRIRNFFEFFDTDELRDQHEIEYLSGSIKDMAKNVDFNFKDETLENFLQKLAYSFPFIGAFVRATISEGGILKFSNFEVYINKNDKNGFWNFVVTDKTMYVVFGVKFNSVNNYDTYVLVDDTDSDNQEIFEKNNISYNDIKLVITYYFIEKLIEYGFDELVEFEFGEIQKRLN